MKKFIPLIKRSNSNSSECKQTSSSESNIGASWWSPQFPLHRRSWWCNWHYLEGIEYQALNTVNSLVTYHIILYRMFVLELSQFFGVLICLLPSFCLYVILFSILHYHNPFWLSFSLRSIKLFSFKAAFQSMFTVHLSDFLLQVFCHCSHVVCTYRQQGALKEMWSCALVPYLCLHCSVVLLCDMMYIWFCGLAMMPQCSLTVSFWTCHFSLNTSSPFCAHNALVISLTRWLASHCMIVTCALKSKKWLIWW